MNFSRKQRIGLLFISFTSIINIAYGNDGIATKDVYQVANVETAGVLNVRQKPSSNSSVILQLPSDAKWIVKLTSERRGNWQKVVWGVKEGWVYKSYINTDPKASKLAAEHRQCVKQNPTNSLCCGFKGSSKSRNKQQIIKTFRVVKVPRGQSLNVRASWGVNAQKIATVPHNASGIVIFPNQRRGHGRSAWQKIHWNGRDGWVNASFIKYDPIYSDYRNIVQQICSS